MSVGRALELRAVEGVWAPGSTVGAVLTLARATLCIHEEALKLLLRRANVEFSDLQMTMDGLVVRVTWKTFLPIEARLVAIRTEDGCLRLQINSLKAASFVSVPSSIVGGVLARSTGKPGIARVGNNSVDIDLSQLLEQRAPAVKLGRLAAVRPLPGCIELDYVQSPAG